MDTARLSVKGQVTIPVGIRRKLGLRAGENVIFIEKSGSVFITSESGITASGPIGLSNESEAGLSQYGGTTGSPFITYKGFLPKEKRCEILDALIGSIDDPTLTEPLETEYESPRDWGLMDL